MFLTWIYLMVGIAGNVIPQKNTAEGNVCLEKTYNILPEHAISIKKGIHFDHHILKIKFQPLHDWLGNINFFQPLQFDASYFLSFFKHPSLIQFENRGPPVVC